MRNFTENQPSDTATPQAQRRIEGKCWMPCSVTLGPTPLKHGLSQTWSGAGSQQAPTNLLSMGAVMPGF